MTQNEQGINLVIIMISQLYDLYHLLNLCVVLCSHQSSIYSVHPSFDTPASTEHTFENEQHIVHNSTVFPRK